jgi:hypothetical protein
LCEHMNRLMIAAGFPVFANRFNQVLNYFIVLKSLAGSKIFKMS